MTAGAVVFWVLAVVTVGSAAVVVLSRSLIYVGGILVLLLFGVMLTHKIYDLDLRSEITQPWAGWLVAIGTFVVLAATAVKTEWATGSPQTPAPTTRTIGELFMGPFLLPFEAASILLLVALMGAAMIVR